MHTVVVLPRQVSAALEAGRREGFRQGLWPYDIQLLPALERCGQHGSVHCHATANGKGSLSSMMLRHMQDGRGPGAGLCLRGRSSLGCERRGVAATSNAVRVDECMAVMAVLGRSSQRVGGPRLASVTCVLAHGQLQVCQCRHKEPHSDLTAKVLIQVYNEALSSACAHLHALWLPALAVLAAISGCCSCWVPGSHTSTIRGATFPRIEFSI